MRITKHTDYALRVLVYLAARGEVRVPTQEIADAYGISGNHLQKVVRALGEMNLVRLQRGPGGGVELAVDPADVSIGVVMRGLDELDTLVECFSAETDACVISPACTLKSALRVAQEAFYASLDELTLADVIKGKRAKALRTLTGD